MPKISEWLAHAASVFQKSGIDSARLDAEIILAHTLRKSRTFLHAHGDLDLDPRQYEISEARLQLRLDRTPVAYIIGHKEFYGRQFKVTPATLIPRPETEEIIELLKKTPEIVQQTLLKTPLRLVDIGTGSGCLGVTAKLELPKLDVTLTDISNHALKVAETNAEQLRADVTILQSNLLEKYPFPPDIILANLPYVDPKWERSEETKYEPELALFAEDKGLHLIKKLIRESSMRLKHSGYLFLEADPRQHAEILQTASRYDFKKITVSGFIIQLQRV